MKKVLIICAIPIMALSFGCQKETASEQKTIENNAGVYEVQVPKLILKILKGTRKQSRLTNSPKICTGRSFCVVGPIGGGDTEPNDVPYVEAEVSGGVEPFDPNSPFSDEHYSFGLTAINGGFEIEVRPEHISTSVAQEVFEDNQFIMDADYYFPEWVCDYFGVTEIRLDAGTYTVTQSSDGIFHFSF